MSLLSKVFGSLTVVCLTLSLLAGFAPSAQATRFGVGCSTYDPPYCSGICALWVTGSCGVNTWNEGSVSAPVTRANCQCMAQATSAH